MRILIVVIAALFSSAVLANDLSDDVVNTLYGMKAVFKAQYAPKDWKKQYAGYDLDQQFASSLAVAQAQTNLTMPAARAIFKDFILSMRDYHTSIKFALTETASLPLSIRGTNERYFIAAIDRNKLSESSFPFQVGDEVVTFGGVPTKDAVTAVQSELIENVAATDKALAEMYLTRRQAARGLSVPKGAFTLGIKRAKTDRVVQHELIWDYTPENVTDRIPMVLRAPVLSGEPKSTLLHPSMTVDADSLDGSQDIGARQTFTPDLGVKVWESSSDDSFYAYIYKTDDRKLIGYVRIAGYIMPDYNKAVADFAKIIKRFQTTTDAMVIDQVNNPGGSVFYLYALASMLTDQPLKTPLHRMTITQNDMINALDAKERFKNVKNDEDAKKVVTADDGADGYPVSYEFARFTVAAADFTINEWNQGRRLSNPFWIGGVNQINPAATHYSKPILILTNHLDFSGGDFFPAIMQDNNRVKILGSRTAGAGGYVLKQTLTNNVGIAFYNVTGSIAERVNGNPIENLGVRPDYEYEMTVEDFTDNYSSYVKAIGTAVADLVK